MQAQAPTRPHSCVRSTLPRRPCSAFLRQYLYFCTSQASQYLYFLKKNTVLVRAALQRLSREYICTCMCMYTKYVLLALLVHTAPAAREERLEHALMLRS